MLKVLLRIILCLFVLALPACKEVQITDDGLTYKQVNKIIATLSDNGIPSQAEKSGRKATDGYRVVVEGNKYLEAIQILDANNLPEKEDPVLKYLTQADGFFSVKSKELEALKRDKILALQIEQTIMSLDQVEDAKVIVRNESIDKEKEGVVVSVRLTQQRATIDVEIHSIVESVFPNLPVDNIKTIISAPKVEATEEAKNGNSNLKVPLEKFFYWHVAYGDANALLITFFLLIIFSCIVCLFFGYVFAVYRHVLLRKVLVKRKKINK